MYFCLRHLELRFRGLLFYGRAPRFVMTSKQAVTYVRELCFLFFSRLIYRFSSLYRRSLKLALDWAVHRYIWRGQAQYIRSLFEANRDVRDPRQQRVSHKRAFWCTLRSRHNFLTVCLGTLARDRSIAGKMEASRPL